MLLLLGAGLVLVEIVNLGAVMVAAYGVPGRLSHVGSLAALVGRAPLDVATPTGSPATSKVDAVVMGDSTAAGLGNGPLPNPSALDRACSRSADSYAQDLAAVNSWNVLSLACSGATIEAGILGPQQVGDLTAPAQLSVAETAKSASVIILSIGANDVGWSDLLRACAIAPTCDNAAFVAYFQQQLAAFSTSYLQLLQQLSALSWHPQVVVNLYYDPFDAAKGCLEKEGVSPAKERTVVAQLNALNSVLTQGATASSFTSVRPSFTGHALCDAQPYVQDVDASAPFHPTASGELAIALADEQALLSPHKPVSSG
jgi:lysophospholipase L1-like esterase